MTADPLQVALAAPRPIGDAPRTPLEVEHGKALRKSGPERSAARKAAEAAGLSRHQMRQMLAVASLPQETFEGLIESDAPPSITTLVCRARNKVARPQARRLTRCPNCGKHLAELKPEGIES